MPKDFQLIVRHSSPYYEWAKMQASGLPSKSVVEGAVGLYVDFDGPEKVEDFVSQLMTGLDKFVVTKGPDVSKWAILNRKLDRWAFSGRQWNTEAEAQKYLDQYLIDEHFAGPDV